MTILRQEQILPISIEQAWDFFSSPANLNIITPESMKFSFQSKLPENIYSGLVIHYKISPFPFMRVKWTTKITDVEKHVFFADEQLKGPYAYWRHEHYFTRVDGGVKITDIVNYKIGKSMFGWIAGKLFVHNRVKEIFKFRREKLVDLFSKSKS